MPVTRSAPRAISLCLSQIAPLTPRSPHARVGHSRLGFRREMLFMRARSDEQHATNSSTRGRLLWVELVMMSVVILMAFWQINYLKNYFRQKKVI